MKQIKTRSVQSVKADGTNLVLCSYCGKLILKRLSELGDTFGGKMGVFHNQLNIHIVA